MSDTDLALVALCPVCGLVTAASIIKYATRADMREHKRDWAERGDILDEMTVAQVHAHGWCKREHDDARERVAAMVAKTKAGA